MTKTKTPTLNATEIAKLMGCKPNSAISRLVALGYTEVCGRCAGSGRYSWNQIDGDRCFGCGGSGKKLAKITAAVVTEALARIAAGELAGYFAENAARREMNAADKALWAAYMGSPISTAYTAASRGHRTTEEIHAFVDSSPVYRAQSFQNSIMDRAGEIMRDRKRTHLERITAVRAAREMVLALNAAWVAFAG